jgi:hypothetical protein
MKPTPGARRILYAAFACTVLFGVVGFFVLPPIIRAQAEKRISAELGRTVSIGKVHVNPFALSIAVEDLDIREKDGSGSFMGWQRLYVRFDAFASLTGDWVLGAIELDGFHSAVVVNPDGSFNFSDILARYPSKPSGTAKPGRPLRIGSLRVSAAHFDFSDHSLQRPFSTQIGPLTFTLSGFRTVGARGAPYHFEALTDAGERLAWSGTLSADPVKSAGEFQVENLVLKKYAPYFERLLLADIVDGKLSVRGRYLADFNPATRSMSLGDSDIHVRGLKVVERASGKSAFELEALDVEGLQADAVALKASVGRIALTGGRIFVRRDKNGSVNLVQLMAPASATPSPSGTGALPVFATAPQVTIGEVAVKDSAVYVVDQAVPGDAHLSLGNLQLSLRNVSLAEGAAMPMHLSFDWAPKGAVELDGTVVLKPAMTADLKVAVNALDVLPLSPYLEHQVNARITRGAFTTASSLHVSMAAGQPAGSLEGDVSVDTLGLVDAAHSQDLAGFSHLGFNGLKVETAPRLAVAIKEIDVGGPYARVRIGVDKLLNVSSIMRRSEAIPVAASPGAAVAAPVIEIGRVNILGGDFSFLDLSVEPNVHASLSSFAGTLSGLSSENLARAEVGLKGVVDGSGTLEISGKLDPLGARKFVSLKIDVANVDLLFLSPYVGKFAGYQLARGQLLVDSKILVDGDAVDSTNVVTLKQFTFGSATSSPDATALPVRLGVALLKDTDGKIVIDLPVQGSMANPEFRIGRVVLRVIVNLLTKAAVSPFSLIGSMFGGGGEELAFQEFAPGSSALQLSELPKLETLAKALSNRPALSLGLEGGYDEAADTYALRRSKLAGLLRRRIWEERRRASPNIPPPDELVISPEENAAMVKTLFDSKFPPGTQFGTPLPLPPPVAPPPAGPPPGLLRRIADRITFKAAREERANKKESEHMAAKHGEDVVRAVAAGLPLDQMTGRLAESMTVTDDDLRALASERAQNVRTHLIEAGHIAADRLFLAGTTEPGRENKGPRVLLVLQ